jgi:hypothetical protein
MDVQFNLKLPFSGWDYFPLPNVASTAEQYELIINFQLPAFVAKLFGVDVSENTHSNSGDRYQLPLESPFVSEARRRIEAGNFTLCKEGVGGTYFVNNPDGSAMGIFKPSDEEPGSPNNPKTIIKNPILPPGGGSLRELVAYFMDKQNFAGVPPTFFLSNVQSKGFSTSDEKFGSLQAFVENDGESSSFGSNVFSTEDVHRIGTLDIRLFNMDRNGENLLVRKQDGQVRLIPIDHTYCLPPVSSLDGAFFEWQYWSQAKKPFSQQTKDYVDSLDVQQDIRLLRSLRISEECIATMVVSTLLLKEAVSAGWTLYDIACLMSRGVPLTNPSKLEEIISKCAASTKENTPSLSPAFLDAYRQALKAAITPKPEQLQA